MHGSTALLPVQAARHVVQVASSCTPLLHSNALPGIGLHSFALHTTEVQCWRLMAHKAVPELTQQARGRSDRQNILALRLQALLCHGKCLQYLSIASALSHLSHLPL